MFEAGNNEEHPGFQNASESFFFFFKERTWQEENAFYFNDGTVERKSGDGDGYLAKNQFLIIQAFLFDAQGSWGKHQQSSCS